MIKVKLKQNPIADFKIYNPPRK